MHFSFRRLAPKTKAAKLSFVRIFLGIGFSGVEAILAIYLLYLGLTESQIGFLGGFFLFLSLVAAIYLVPLMQKFRAYPLFIASMIVTIIGLILLSLIDSIVFFVIIMSVLSFAAVVRWNAFQIVFHHSVNENKLAQAESLFYTLENIGWFLGPLIAAYILVTQSIEVVFFSSALFLIIATVLFFKIKAPKQKTHKPTRIRENLKAFFKQPKLLIPYSVGLGIEIWFAFMTIYTPLIMIKAGLAEDVVAIYLALTIIPLILLEFFAGKLAMKKGYKKLLVAGFSVMVLSLIIAFFISNIWFFLATIFVGSIAMAFVEPLQDAYFFSFIKKQDDGVLYPTYATSGDIGSMLGRVIIAAGLLVFPLKVATLITAALLGTIIIILLRKAI